MKFKYDFFIVILALIAMGIAIKKSIAGCWGLSLGWSLFALAHWLWSQAKQADLFVKRKSQIASLSYLSGEKCLEGDTNHDIKKGALAGLLSLCFMACSMIILLGCFLMGLGWGILAWIPLVPRAVECFKGYKNLTGALNE